MEYQFPTLPILVTFLLFVFLILKIRKVSKTGPSTSSNLPPGPWKLPLIGNLHQFVASLPHHCLTDLAKKYGPLMNIQLGEVQFIVVSSRETAREVLKVHDINFADRPRLLPARFYDFKDIAFAPYGDYWRQLRKICTVELLTAKRVQSFRSIREEEVSNLVRYVYANAGTPINFTKMLYSMTNNITARAAFGLRCQQQEAFLQFNLRILKLLSGFSIADLFPSSKLIEVLSGMGSAVEKCMREGDKILDNIINDHVAHKATGKGRTGGKEENLLDLLLNVMDGGELEVPITIDNIKAVILDLFIAGTETSSSTAAWAIAEMVKNSRVLEKAQAEVREIYDKKGNDGEANLDELEYLKLVIKETLRLHPPVPLLIPRECRKSCEINGYSIPKGTRIFVNAWAMGRDPKYWTKAESFYPERFLATSVDYKGNNFEFVPFGAGRRMCPGISFGIPNIELPLATLLYHFDFKLPNGLKNEDLDMTESFLSSVVRKNDLYLIPTPRHPPPYK